MAQFEFMESDVVGMGPEHPITSVTPAVCCFGTEKMALELPKVAIDALEFQNLDSEDDVCRICEERGNSSQRSLLHHCACKGSIGYVHKDCLENWLELSRARQCEICKQDYPFTIPVFADRPEEAPDEYDFILHLDIRIWLIPMLWVILNHIAVVGCTVPKGRSWLTDGLWGSIIYFLFFLFAYLAWRFYVLNFPEFMADAYLVEDPFVFDMVHRRDVRAAALSYLLPSNLFDDGVEDMGGIAPEDIGGIAPDYMQLAYELYNTTIDNGAAAFNYMTSFVPYYIEVFVATFDCMACYIPYCSALGADGDLDYPVGIAQYIDFMHSTANDYNSDRNFWKTICMVVCVPLVEIALFIIMFTTVQYWYTVAETDYDYNLGSLAQ